MDGITKNEVKVMLIEDNSNEDAYPELGFETRLAKALTQIGCNNILKVEYSTCEIEDEIIHFSLIIYKE